MTAVEIVPGTAIGAVKLGALEHDLPTGATVAHGVGHVEFVHFSIAEGRVDDVWIDDLANFPHDLRFKGQALPRPITLDKLRSIFGNCFQADAMLGGIFYNCSGVTIGCDHENHPTQLRLKPR